MTARYASQYETGTTRRLSHRRDRRATGDEVRISWKPSIPLSSARWAAIVGRWLRRCKRQVFDRFRCCPHLDLEVVTRTIQAIHQLVFERVERAIVHHAGHLRLRGARTSGWLLIQPEDVHRLSDLEIVSQNRCLTHLHAASRNGVNTSTAFGQRCPFVSQVMAWRSGPVRVDKGHFRPLYH